MYFTVNTAFVNYLDSLDNLTDSLKFPILLNRTTYKQSLLISLKSFHFDSELLKAPKTLEDFVHQFWHKKESSDLQERHDNHNNNLDLPNKNFLFKNSTTIVMYVLCKHTKLKCLVTSLGLQQIKEVGVVAKQEHVSIVKEMKCTCNIQWYTILMLSLSILGLVVFIILKSRK